MNALLAFAAALVSLRLAALLIARSRKERTRPELVAWAAALLAYAVAAAALAWGAAGGWDDASFRVYYLAGALLTAPLLAVGSLLLIGVRAVSIGIAYSALAVGIMIAEPLTGPVSGSAIPAAQDHLDLFPARVLAILGNSVGTVVIVVVLALSFRRRPLGNALIFGGVVVAAFGTAVAGLGEAGTSVFVVVAAVLLYAGFVSPLREQPEPGDGIEHHEREQGVLGT